MQSPAPQTQSKIDFNCISDWAKGLKKLAVWCCPLSSAICSSFAYDHYLSGPQLPPLEGEVVLFSAITHGLPC